MSPPWRIYPKAQFSVTLNAVRAFLVLLVYSLVCGPLIS